MRMVYVKSNMNKFIIILKIRNQIKRLLIKKKKKKKILKELQINIL